MKGLRCTAVDLFYERNQSKDHKHDELLFFVVQYGVECHNYRKNETDLL